MSDDNAALSFGKGCTESRAQVRSRKHTRNSNPAFDWIIETPTKGRKGAMKLKDKIKQTGAAGYILLWLLGIPIPILLIIFLLRGCT